jgi:hypothetical protein
MIVVIVCCKIIGLYDTLTLLLLGQLSLDSVSFYRYPCLLFLLDDLCLLILIDDVTDLSPLIDHVASLDLLTSLGDFGVHLLETVFQFIIPAEDRFCHVQGSNYMYST